MSIYAVSKICRMVQFNPEFRARMQHDPAAAIADFPLTDEERSALLAGEVGKLHDMGVHGFLLSRLPMFGVLGLDTESYVRQLRPGPPG